MHTMQLYSFILSASVQDSETISISLYIDMLRYVKKLRYSNATC